MKDLVFYFNGNISNISDIIQNNNFDLVKIDEKELTKFKFLLSKINAFKYNRLFFYVIDVDYQRFQFFCKSYILFSRIFKGGIIDESNNFVKFNLSGYFFKDMPLFILEILTSFIIILISYPIYFYYKCILRKK